MKRVNKPQVFLSFSSKNSEFIDRIERDLRRCKIEPWRYEAEVRHGKPLLEEIFSHGIPRVDALLSYVTPSYLESEVCKRELDAGLIRQLSDKSVGFLLYPCDDSLRGQLRSDLQTLVCPTWNDSNYESLLPEVVAAIIHTYAERLATRASQEERVRRLELELENTQLKKATEASIFTPAQESDFAYVKSKLDVKLSGKGELREGEPGKLKGALKTFKVSTNLLSAVVLYLRRGHLTVSEAEFGWFVKETFVEAMDRVDPKTENTTWVLAGFQPHCESLLARMRLTEPVAIEQAGLSGSGGTIFRTHFSERMRDFSYWLDRSGWECEQLEFTRE